MTNMQTRCFFSRNFSSDWLNLSEQWHHFSHITLRKEERNTVWWHWRTSNNANDQQENVCENVCLFSALNSHHAANSLSRPIRPADEIYNAKVGGASSPQKPKEVSPTKKLFPSSQFPLSFLSASSQDQLR